jgi:putative oxidoreductase
MESPLARFAEQIYAAFRIVVGGMFALHGAQKIFGVLGGFGGTPGATAPFGTQMWVGGMIELVCGALVLLGVQARWAAFLASGEMAVAYFQFHQPKGALPVQNGGEPAVIYCFAFLLIAARGAGVWTISRRRG